MKNIWLLSSIFLSTVITFNSAQAIELRSGFGGPEGFGDLSQLPNDDESSSKLNLPFTLNFFGQNYSTFWVNNNGNITFRGPLDEYTPAPFPIANQPMVAAWWGDVDTSAEGGGAVYTASPDQNTLVNTWHNVGYYDAHNDKANDFQMTLLNRPDTGTGNFDIELRIGNFNGLRVMQVTVPAARGVFQRRQGMMPATKRIFLSFRVFHPICSSTCQHKQCGHEHAWSLDHGDPKRQNIRWIFTGGPTPT